MEVVQPNETSYIRRTSQFFKQLSRHTPVIPPVSRAAFVARYSGRARARYERAAVALAERERKGFPTITQKDANLSNFMKVEKLLSAKLDKAPRNISPRTPEYNIELGILIGHLEKPLFRALQLTCGFPVVFKGMNASQ